MTECKDAEEEPSETYSLSLESSRVFWRSALACQLAFACTLCPVKVQAQRRVNPMQPVMQPCSLTCMGQTLVWREIDAKLKSPPTDEQHDTNRPTAWTSRSPGEPRNPVFILWSLASHLGGYSGSTSVLVSLIACAKGQNRYIKFSARVLVECAKKVGAGVRLN